MILFCMVAVGVVLIAASLWSRHRRMFISDFLADVGVICVCTGLGVLVLRAVVGMFR